MRRGVPALPKCTDCNGTGRVPKRVETPAGYVTTHDTCPKCNGGGLMAPDAR